MKRFTSYLLSLVVAGLTLVSVTAEAESLKERLNRKTRPVMQVLGENTLKPLQFQMEQNGMKTFKKGAMLRAPQLAANLKSSAWGFIEGPDGIWTYTQTFEEANYYYTKSVITLYNTKHQQVGQITIDIPDGRKVNAIQPMNLVTNKMFDKNADTYEVAIYMHEVGEMSDNGMTVEQIYMTKVYSTDGTLVYESRGLGMFVDMQLNEWTRYQRMVNVLNPNDYDTLNIQVIAPPGWNAEPTVEHTFQIPYELTNYSDGGYISVAQIDNQPYYVISHYEKPWASGYDYETFDPIPTEDNHFQVKVYNKNFKMVDSLNVPIEKSEDALYRFATFGLMSDKDISKNYFTQDGNMNFVISFYEYMTSTDSYSYKFVLVDNKGNEIKAICDDVTETYFELSDIQGHESQMAFMQQIGDKQQISMIDFPSCNVAAVIPAELHGEQISTTLDRYPKNGSYQYAISMGSAIGDANDNVIARIGWYNKDLSFDHFSSFNLGPYGQMFTPLIDSDGLNPYLFDTDDEHEFAYIAKIGNALNSKLDNMLFIANEDGSLIQQFVGNSFIGDLYSPVPLNTKSSNPELVLVYYSYENDLFDLNYYKLPFSKFQGGSGTVADPYLVGTVGDLLQVKCDLDACYKLVADLDLGNMPSAWTPINGFSGKIDGNGHSIANMTINTTAANAGFVGEMTEGGSIRNLVFVNPTIQINKGNSFVGVVAGMAMTDTLQNVHVYGANIIDASATVDATIGGLVGQATIYSEISSCSFEGTVNAPKSTAMGGIAGDTRTSSYVKACMATGEMTAESALGGIVGVAGTDGKVQNCHTDMKLAALHTVGGIVGNNGSRSVISNCYVKGTIKAKKASWNGFAAGGVMGRVKSSWPNEKGVRDETIIASGNVVMADIVAGAEAKPKTTHRIVGYTIADEDYMPGEKRYQEIGLANNYALSTMKINGAAISSEDDKSTEGASKASADMSKDFFAGLGYLYGNDAANPWKGSKGLPKLYFEDVAKELAVDNASLMIAEGNSKDLVITIYGAEASEINVATSDASVAEVEIVSEETNYITVRIYGRKLGNAVITASAGDVTATCNVAVVDQATGIDAVVGGNSAIEAIYSVNGIRRNALKPGLNIVKMSDGKIVKVFHD